MRVGSEREAVSSKKTREKRIFNKTATCLLPIVFLLTISLAEAQQAGKLPRVGILEPGHSTQSVCKDGFRQGLRDLGYMEGQNILLQERYGEFKPDRLRDVAAALVRISPDVIWTHSPIGVQTAKAATTKIPVVAGVATGLVELGVVTSLARPGSNVTGMELADLEILGKRLELLKQAVPTASRVAVLVDADHPPHNRIPGNIDAEARALRVELRRIEVRTHEAFEKAFSAMTQTRTEALLVPEGVMFSRHRQRLFSLAAKSRLPTAAGGAHFTEAGSLLSYGANPTDICRRSAVYVDKILKGSKPADLPIERPTKFELVINLKTAKQIGLIIPPNVLARADRVIR
jgi:putative tryptophan/tyrosine transport system substrate-binding protein